VVALALVAAPAMRARAQTELPLELSWRAPPGCPSGAAVREQLARVARVRPGFTLTRLSARAVVTRSEAGYALRLETEQDGRRGERRLRAADCDALASSVTLVLALAFGPGVEVVAEPVAQTAPDGNAQPATQGAQATREAPDPAALRAPREAPRAAGDRAREDTDVAQTDADAVAEANADEHDPGAAGWGEGPARLSVLLGAGAQLALLTSTALGASAGVELEIGALALGLRATAWPAVSDDVAARLSARFDGLGGDLHGCGHTPVATLSLALCAGARVAALRGRSAGAREDGSDTAPYYALAGSAALTWPRGAALRVRIEAALAVSLDRARFVIEGLGEVHRVPLLAPNAGVLVMFTP
jgi:hypothetical protein